MISNRYHGSIRLFFLLKVLGGMFLFWAIVWGLHWTVYGERLRPGNYLWLSLLIPAAALVELVARERRNRFLAGLSRERITSITQREILFLLVTMFGVLVMTKEEWFSRAFLGLFSFSYAGWIAWMNQVGSRMLHRRLFRASRHTDANTVVLAPPREIESDCAMRMTGVLPGAEFLGYVSYGSTSAAAMTPTFPVLGEFENIRDICRQCHARMLLALGLDDQPHLIGSLQKFCDSLGMRLIWVDDKRQSFRGNLDAHQAGSQVLLTNWKEPLQDPINRIIKRTFDLIVSTLTLLTIFPFLCLLVWIVQRIYSPGPLFYRQPRTGREGEIFQMIKFRTMHVNETPGLQATSNDSRIFPGGKLMRKLSLDEFPQFLNVFRGEMSTVGPRPHFIDHDEQFAEIVETYRLRHFAKPGVTGLAQIRGCRGETDTPRKVKHRVKLDQFYLRHWSAGLDFFIVICTAFQIVFPPPSAR